MQEPGQKMELCSEAGGQSHRPLELCAGLAAQAVSGPQRERRRQEAPGGADVSPVFCTSMGAGARTVFFGCALSLLKNK